MSERPLIWLGDSREAIRAIADNVLEPNDWKPMPSVGLGVQEIRIHTGAAHRVLYVARFAEAVYVLHAFEKRARRTPKDDLDLARQRLRLLINQRARRKG